MRKTLCFYIICLLNSTLMGQELAAPGGGFAAIIVSEIEESKTWYQEMLGFNEKNHIVNESRGFKIVNMKHGDLGIELIQIKGSIAQDSLFAKSSVSGRLQGLFKFGMYLSDFDTWIKHLQPHFDSLKDQIVRDPVTDKRMLILRDPDGNRIQLFEN